MKFESIPAWFWNLHSEIEESFIINSVLCIKHFAFTETTNWLLKCLHTHTQSSSSLIHFQPVVFAQCRQSFTVCTARANFPKRRMNKSTVFLFFPPLFLPYFILFCSSLFLPLWVKKENSRKLSYWYVSHFWVGTEHIKLLFSSLLPAHLHPQPPKDLILLQLQRKAVSCQTAAALRMWMPQGWKGPFTRTPRGGVSLALTDKRLPYPRRQRLLPGTAIWLSCKD